jgi:hypothetical protein
MTPLSLALNLFPAGLLALIAFDLAWLVLGREPLAALLLPGIVYGLPVLCFRLHERLWPLTQGRCDLAAPVYAPWWGGHQLQWIYLAFPSLEAALRAVPGLFSVWLRAWGSQIGRNVYWTPELTIADRSLLEVGDGAIFGHRVAISAHLVKPAADGGLHCVVKRVVVGAGAFVGAGATLGPGAVVAPGALLPAGSVVLFGRVRPGP